jgi:hypothetical protein
LFRKKWKSWLPNRTICGFVSTVGQCDQGCQMVYFNTKNINLGIFWRDLMWKILVNFCGLFGIFYGHLVMLWSFGKFFPRYGILYEQKSGNPECDQKCCQKITTQRSNAHQYCPLLKRIFYWS